MGHINAEDYSKKAREAAKLMKLTDPNIKLIAAGSSNYRPTADPNEWNATILKELKNVVDYLAIHIYVGNPDNNYYNFMSTPLVMEQRTKIIKGMIAREMAQANRVSKDPIYIAWDEYNVWYRARRGESARGTRALEEHYNLEDALVIAGFLNGFIRNADIVKMANLAQLVNVIGPIFTNEKGMFRQTIYFPLQLFAQNMAGKSLDVHVACETYDTEEFLIGLGEQKTEQKNVPYLDVSAAINKDEIILSVVNRNKDKAITTDIILQEGSFDGKLSVYEVNGADVKTEKKMITLIQKKWCPKEHDSIAVKGQKNNHVQFPASFLYAYQGQSKMRSLYLKRNALFNSLIKLLRIEFIEIRTFA